MTRRAPSRALMRRDAGRAMAALALLAGAAADRVTAQVVTDGLVGTAPPSSLGFDVDAVLTVPAALGEQRGPNLFHSFSQLGVPVGAQVILETPPTAARMIARVTDAAPSRIDGSLGLSAPADLFLISPGGLIIGPDGSIDNARGLHLSAGDALIFEDGATFAATAGAQPVLSVAAPAAFGFLTDAPGALTLDRGTIPTTGALTLAGGAVVIDNGFIVSEFGDPVTLAAAGPGETAPLAGGDAGGPPPVGGAIRILGQGPVDSGQGPRPSAGIDQGRGGAVTLRAGSLTVDGAEVVVDRLFEAPLDPPAALDVSARSIVVTRDGALRTRTLRDAPAGAITIRDFDTLLVTRAGSTNPLGETVIESEVLPGAAGDAGAIVIRGGALTLADSGRIFSNTGGAGDAGVVDVRVDTLRLEGGGQIASAALDVAGRPAARGGGGVVTVTAADSLTATGESRTLNPISGDFEPSGVFSSTEGALSGPAGAVFVSAPLITLLNEAEIAAETRNAAPAGALTLRSGALTLDGGAEITTLSLGAGPAGAVDIAVDGPVALSGGAQITSEAQVSPAPAGVVTLRSDALTLTSGAQITTQSADNDGGGLTLTVGGLTTLDAASLTTSVAGGGGDGGDIAVTSDFLVLRNGGVIRANAVAGDGGDITLTARAVIAEPGSVIEAVSVTGDDGDIVVVGAATAPTAELRPPPADFFDSFALVDDSCVAAVTGGSALTLAGPQAAAPDARAAPGLFGAAIPYPAQTAPGSAASRDAATFAGTFRAPCAGGATGR